MTTLPNGESVYLKLNNSKIGEQRSISNKKIRRIESTNTKQELKLTTLKLQKLLRNIELIIKLLLVKSKKRNKNSFKAK